MTDPTNRLLELDERHNQLLAQLADLDRQASSILDDWAKAKLQREQSDRIDQAMENMENAGPNDEMASDPAQAA